MNELILLDSSRGRYIPQNFLEIYGDNVRNISNEDFNIIKNDLDHEFYWEIWDEILGEIILTINGVSYLVEYNDNGDFIAYEL